MNFPKYFGMKIIKILFSIELGIRRYKLHALSLFFGSSLLAFIVLFSSPVQPQPEQARSADAFVDSIGINTHLIGQNSIYAQQYKTIIKPRLQELGICHIRDGNEVNQPEYYARLKDLALIGIRSTLINSIGHVTPEQALMESKKIGSAVEAIEGSNEYDNSKNLSESWVLDLRNYMQQLHSLFKNDSTTSHLPIIGPSFVKRESSALVGDLSQWVDYGNMHPYNFPNHPGDGNIDREVSNRSKPFGGKPMIATEAGYYTASPQIDRTLSEGAQGKYLPRLFLEYFNRGVFRTFSYEFIDQRLNPNNKEANFGILRNNGSPKPAFLTLKNLITILQDPGKSFPLKSLNYSLSGNTIDVHHTLLQKRNGNFYLIIWQDVPSFSLITKTDIIVEKLPIILTLNTPIKKVNIYENIYSKNLSKHYQNSPKIKLLIPDYPLIVELVP